MAQKKKGKIGSSFDAFLAEEGILEASEEQALKQILAGQIKAAMARRATPLSGIVKEEGPQR